MTSITRPGPDGGPASLRHDERAQTAIDFSVGIGVFLLAVVFVFAFTPNIFDPFTAESGGKIVLADRSADQLSGDILIESPTRPGQLNASCTEGFFDGDGSMPSGCYYTGIDSDDLETALGIDQPGISVNVTITDGGTVRSISGTDLTAGPDVPSNTDVSVARRVVMLDGEESRLTVRVW